MISDSSAMRAFRTEYFDERLEEKLDQNFNAAGSGVVEEVGS